jgi:hypothetical protein
MKIISSIVERVRVRDLKKSTERVNEDYQIAERDGQLWLTFWGHPIVPQNMLNGDIVGCLKEIRKLHINDKI